MIRAGLCALSLALGGPAWAECRMALALGLDVSGSVDVEESRLQRQGVAQALTTEDVVAAFLADPTAPVDLMVFEWSGLTTQHVLSGWTTIRTEADLQAVAAVLVAPLVLPREAETAVGLAMQYGAARIAERPGCWRRVLDLSSDGRSNIGPQPRAVRNRGDLAGVTVNALVIGAADVAPSAPRADSVDSLSAYFRAEVIQGAEAFVQAARGFADYKAAMEKKLLRELQVPAVGRTEDPGRPRLASAGR